MSNLDEYFVFENGEDEYVFKFDISMNLVPYLLVMVTYDYRNRYDAYAFSHRKDLINNKLVWENNEYTIFPDGLRQYCERVFNVLEFK